MNPDDQENIEQEELGANQAGNIQAGFDEQASKTKEKFWSRVEDGVVHFDYTPNQTLQESLDQLNRKYSTHLYRDEKVVLDMVRQMDPTYVPDLTKREERRELSRQARQNFFTCLHNQRSSRPAQTITRGIDMLLDFSGTEEAIEHNKKIGSLFEVQGSTPVNPDKAGRTREVEKFIDKVAKEMDFDKLFTWTDKELVENFPKFFFMYSLLGEAGDTLVKMSGDSPESLFNISERHVNMVLDWRAKYQGQFGELKGRFDFLMNPHYEIVDLDRVSYTGKGHQSPENVFDFNPENEEKLQADKDLNAFSLAVQNRKTMEEFSWESKIHRLVRKAGMDPKTAVYQDSAGKTYNVTPESRKVGRDLERLSDGVRVMQAKDPVTGQICLMHAEGKNLVALDPLKGLSRAQERADAVLKALEDADPWHIRTFTGSKEYGDMKKAMKEVREFLSKIEPPSSEKEFKELDKAMKEHMKDLLDASNEYLKKKDEPNSQTKRSELLRVDAAAQLQNFIQDAQLMVDSYAQTVNMRLQARTAQGNAMKKQIDEEKRFERPRDASMKVQAPEKTNAEKNRDFNKVWAVYYDEAEKIGGPIAATGREIRDGYDGVSADVCNVMAHMVAYDLVMRDRAANKGKTGPIEKQYLADPEQFIQGLENSTRLKDMAASVEKNNELKEFILAAAQKNGTMKLTDNVLAEQVALFKRQPEQPAQQIQQQQIQQESAVKSASNALIK